MAQGHQYASRTPPPSPQQPLPLLPQSPESLSQGEAFANHHTSAATIDTSVLTRPERLHLKPVTWESLEQINFPPGERFEIVDGLLVWIPMGNGKKKHQRIIRALVEFINLLASWRAISCLDVEVDSISGNSHAPNSRTPDVIVTRRRPGSPSGFSSDSGPRIQKHVLLTKDKPAYAQIEVTSESTRSTDLNAKWVQYRNTGVTFYYIIDLHVLETLGTARVIVGSKDRISNWARCTNGDPDDSDSSSSSNPNAEELSGFYYKKVYTETDLVDVGVFQDKPLTASQLMSCTFLNNKVERIKQRNANLSQQNATKYRRIDDLSQQLATKDRRIDDLSQQNQRLQAELARSRGSSSNFRPHMQQAKQKRSPTSLPRRQSAQSQSTSPTNSPNKKRHKPKK